MAKLVGMSHAWHAHCFELPRTELNLSNTEMYEKFKLKWTKLITYESGFLNSTSFSFCLR